jgi:aminobenzoyl-glutamate transport protein
VRVIVPLLFFGFLLPGVVYGVATGSVRSDKDAAGILAQTMAGMGPYIVLAFFAAQFIEYFRHSGLGEMLAISGGQALTRAQLPPTLLMAAFVGVVMIGNLFIGSMSAKYAFFAPVFVPMFMQVGISAELTQAAYRVGDSVSNVITPLNPYVVIILVFMQRYVPRAGIGTLVALMLPYAIVFGLTWTALLVLWMLSGAPLGPGGPLTYAP